MDATKIQQSLEDLMGVFYKRMDSFEGKLQKTPSTADTDPLALEFSSFKTFVITSLRALQAQIEMLAKETDQLEMRSRRKMLMLHGLPEGADEVTADVVVGAVVHKLKQAAFVVTDISRCHRMGRPVSADRPRPILCKFRDVTVRDKLWSAKASLKGTGITVSEFLTKTRHSLFMAAREKYGVAKCWTREGFVFVLNPEGVRHRISCPADLDNVSQKEVSKQIAPKRTKRAAARK